MFSPPELPTVTMRELSRSGRVVLERILHGGGLARKSKRGFIITGRGLMLREALLEKAGRTKELYD